MSVSVYIVGIILCVFSAGSTFCNVSAKTVLQTNESVEVNELVNGESVPISEFSYQVNLESHGNNNIFSIFFGTSQSAFCGGAIISKYHILTATHCIIQCSSTFVRTGSSIQNQGEWHNVVNCNFHKDYNKYMFINDIVVLTLQNPIVFNTYQNPISLPPKKGGEIRGGEIARIAGWGSGNPRILALHNKLEAITLRIVSPNECDVTDKFKICAIDERRHAGICYGDSGGPLVVNDRLVGILSTTSGKYPCDPRSRSAYVNVHHYLSFIENAMKNRNA